MRSSSSFSPSANTLKPLARLVRATAFGLALGASAPLLAEPVRIDLPAQPLASALTSLGEQTELQILFNPAQLSRLRSNAVTGEMEALQALDALLEGTGVRYQLDGNRVSLFTSAGDSALALPEQVIEGRSEGQSSFVPKTSNSASKTNTSILEIPQSVSVITRAQLEAQGAQSVTEALRYVPGVKVETYGLDPKATTGCSFAASTARAPATTSTACVSRTTTTPCFAASPMHSKESMWFAAPPRHCSVRVMLAA